MRTHIFCLAPASSLASPIEAARARALLTAREARLPTNPRKAEARFPTNDGSYTSFW